MSGVEARVQGPCIERAFPVFCEIIFALLDASLEITCRNTVLIFLRLVSYPFVPECVGTDGSGVTDAAAAAPIDHWVNAPAVAIPAVTSLKLLPSRRSVSDTPRGSPPSSSTQNQT